jgi:hypothetical protein
MMILKLLRHVTEYGGTPYVHAGQRYVERQNKCINLNTCSNSTSPLAPDAFGGSEWECNEHLTSILKILLVSFPAILTSIFEHLFYAAGFESFLKILDQLQPFSKTMMMVAVWSRWTYS